MHAKFLAPSVAVVLAAHLNATTVGLSTIEQPVNLGEQSDPSRIPLGAVATESNYHYGRGPVITAPRPCLYGGMAWKSGVELNQNLASVFGIELNDHDLPESPAVIRMRSFAKPAYSPYTKEQVLAATIHCILRSNRGTPERPIQLEITAEAPEEKALAEKFAGEYINASNQPNDPPVDPTPVPGTKLETDSRGITWVVFGESKKDVPPPVLIPFRLGGESGPDSPTWELLPVWSFGGVSGPELLGRPYPLFYDCFKPGRGMGPETNAIFAGKPAGSIDGFDVTEEETGTLASFRHPQTNTLNLSATVLALVASVQPTEQHPLTVRLETSLSNFDSWLNSFQSCPGWEAKNLSDRNVLTCVFVMDPGTAALKRGVVPSASIERMPDGKLYIQVPPPTREERELQDAYARRFDEKWNAGEFEPKEDHLEMPGAGLPLVRGYWLAGYRDALAGYRVYQDSAAGDDPDRERDDTSELGETRRKGWLAGIRDGEMFAAKVLEEERVKLATPEVKPADPEMPEGGK